MVAGRTYPAAAARTAVPSAGQASAAHAPNGSSVSTAHATPAAGSTHRNAPDWPKWPKVPGDASGGVQCGSLWSRSSKPRPQGLGDLPTEPGQHAVEVGELRRWSPPRAPPARGRGPVRAARRRTGGGRRASTGPPLAGEPVTHRVGHPERQQHRLCDVVREGHAGPLGDELGRGPRRRGCRRSGAVPAAAIGSSPSNGRPGRVAEEEPHGRPGWPGRLVEGDDLLLAPPPAPRSPSAAWSPTPAGTSYAAVARASRSPVGSPPSTGAGAHRASVSSPSRPSELNRTR